MITQDEKDELRLDFIKDKRMEEDYDFFLDNHQELIEDLHIAVKRLRNAHTLFGWEFDLYDHL